MVPGPPVLPGPYPPRARTHAPPSSSGPTRKHYWSAHHDPVKPSVKSQVWYCSRESCVSDFSASARDPAHLQNKNHIIYTHTVRHRGMGTGICRGVDAYIARLELSYCSARRRCLYSTIGKTLRSHTHPWISSSSETVVKRGGAMANPNSCNCRVTS